MGNRVVATSAFGNPAEAARIREANTERQQKEAARPSSQNRLSKQKRHLKHWLRKKLKKLKRDNPALG